MIRHDEGRRRQGYCGPTSLGLALGLTSEDAADLVNALRRRERDTEVQGMYDHEVTAILNGLGARYTPEQGEWRTTVTPDKVVRRWDPRAGVYRTRVQHYGLFNMCGETLCQFFHRVLKHLPDDAVSIVGVTGHYVAFVGGTFVDTHIPEGADYRSLRRFKRNRVKQAWVNVQV